MKKDSGNKWSRVVGWKLTQLGGLYIQNPSLGLMRMNSSFSPLYNLDNIFAKAAGVSGSFRPQRVASSSPQDTLGIGVAKLLALCISP